MPLVTPFQTLKSEVDERSANSAQLMVQLHKAKVQYKQCVDRQAVDGTAAPSPHRPSPPRSSSLNQLRPRVVRRRATSVNVKGDHSADSGNAAATTFNAINAVRSPVRATSRKPDSSPFVMRKHHEVEEEHSRPLPVYGAVPPILRTLPATPSLEQR